MSMLVRADPRREPCSKFDRAGASQSTLNTPEVHGASLCGRQAHLADNGLITVIRVQEVKIWKVLEMHQPGFVVLVSLLEVAERLVFAVQARVSVGKFEW